jgi:hypothetical protein
MTQQQSYIASFVAQSAHLLARCDKVSIHAAGTLSAAANGRLAVVATDNLGIGVFLFHEVDGKMIHEHDIDCESVQVALESFRNWLQLKEVAA